MLDDKYSLLDYLKFICNTKIKYEPRSKSYFQPFLYYLFAVIVSFLSFGIITIDKPLFFWPQVVIYAFSVVLFTTLILPPKVLEKHHGYNYYAERQEINRLCMVCIRPIQFREYHCTTCQQCTAQYDHHCFWINNCVGKYNILRFNVFLILSELCLCWVSYLSVRIFMILQTGG
jgi:hypothetical protein